MRAFGFILILLFGFVAGPLSAQDASDDSNTAALDNADIPVVELIPPKEVWLLGKSHELKVQIEHLSSVRVYFPQKPVLPNLLLEEVREKREVLADQRIRSTMTLTMVPLRLDVQRLPTLDVAWRSLTDSNKSGSIPVDLGRAAVVGQVENPADARLGVAPEGLNVRERNMTLIIGLIALASALAAILLTLAMIFLLKKTTFRRSAPVIPPDEEALSALTELRAQSVAMEEEPAPFVTKTSEVLRRYLGRRYSFEALEATSEELLSHLEQVAPKGLSTLELNQLLRGMDMVKFAAQSIEAGDVTNQMSMVESLVLSSRERAEERAARELERKALLPDPSERSLALAVDLSVGGLLALLFHGIAVFTGDSFYFTIALATLGLWLFLRDFTDRSPGKKVARLRLVPSTAAADRKGGFLWDEVPSLSARIFRNLTILPVVTIPAEVVAGLFLPEQRRLGDLICKTRIVRSEVGVQRPDLKLLIAAWSLASILVLAPAFWAMSLVRWGGML